MRAYEPSVQFCPVLSEIDIFNRKTSNIRDQNGEIEADDRKDLEANNNPETR
jgi:hypothetical protein